MTTNPEPSSTRNQVVVVTGASAGVGRATVREFARHGAHVGLIARGTEGLEAAKQEVEKLGGKAIAISCDVADPAAVDQAASRIEDELGPIDVWVNNAFAGVISPFLEMTPEEYRRVTEVTYFGQVWGTMTALRRMVPRNRGSVVLVGSALAYRGIPLQSAYCGAKHAIQGFQDSVRSELLHTGSNVALTMVQLPGVNTPQFDWVRARVAGRPRPAGTIYQPEVAARAIRFAAYAGRKEIQVGLPAVQAILGDKIASSLLDHYLADTGFKSQQEDEPISRDRRDNLFEPVPGDRGAHGRFDAEASESSAQLWATTNRSLLGIGALALAACGTAVMLLRRRPGSSRMARG